MGENSTRCNGCGKPIESNEGVKRVLSGTLKGNSVKNSEEWGVFHKLCFDKSFDHPDAVLEAVKEEAARLAAKHEEPKPDPRSPR